MVKRSELLTVTEKFEKYRMTPLPRTEDGLVLEKSLVRVWRIFHCLRSCAAVLPHGLVVSGGEKMYPMEEGCGQRIRPSDLELTLRSGALEDIFS